MKITVEINDQWLDEGTLEENLRQTIVRESVDKIWEMTKESTEKKIAIAIKKGMLEKMDSKIAEVVNKVIQEGKVKGEYSSDPSLSIEEWIKNKFEKGSGWSSPAEQVGKLAKKYGDEMKKRYDLLFASQIVSNMKDNGLLKEDAAKMLLEVTQPKGK